MGVEFELTSTMLENNVDLSVLKPEAFEINRELVYNIMLALKMNRTSIKILTVSRSTVEL